MTNEGRWCAAAVWALAAACGGSDPDGARPDVEDAAADDTPAGDAGEGDGGDTGGDADLADDALPWDAVDGSADDTPPGDAPPDDAPEDVIAPGCVSGAATGFEAHELGAWVVSVDPGTGAWMVQPPHADAAVLEAPPTCDPAGGATVAWATGVPEVLNLFGAFRFRVDTASSTWAWHDPAGPPALAAERDALTLEYLVPGIEGAAITFSAQGTDLRVEMSGTGTGGRLGWIAATDDAYFGLGTQATGMNLRGRAYPLWTQEQGNGKPEGAPSWPLNNIPEAAYAPAGIWHASAGFSAIVTHDAYSLIDLRADPALTSIGAHPGFVLVAGETPRARLQRITEYTGRPSLPPDWVLAPWNDAVGGPEHLRAVAATLRDNDIPSSAIWSEDWIGGAQSSTGYRLSYAWAWSPAQYPDLPEDIAFLHEHGFAFLAYFNPFVPSDVPMWDEGVEGGFLVERPDGTVREITDPAFRTAGQVELTDPDAVAWVQSYIERAARDLGVDGWMCDFSEWYPVDALPRDGSSPWTAHNQYPLLWQRVNRAALEGVHATEDDPRQWTFFSRAGWASIHGGTGGISPVHWAGDQNTNWDADDGIPTVVPIGTHAGLSGITLFGSDIGGYNSFAGANTTKELFYRWTSLGAFSPVMRTHHGSDECGNWNFDRDDETRAHYRRYAIVHTLLFPTLRALVDDAAATGMPVMRHPFLVFPELPSLVEAPTAQYFLGDDILVAPVVDEGAEQQVVRLPSAGWWPLFAGAPVSTGTPAGDGTLDVTVPAPATEIPVFVAPGTAVTLLGVAPDTFYGATAPGVTSLGDVGARVVALYPDAAGGATGHTLGVTVSATALTGSWAGATWRGDPLPECDGVATACVDGARVHVAGDGVLDGPGGRVEIAGGPEDRTWTLALGGAAWGPIAERPAEPDLDAIVPPPCGE